GGGGADPRPTRRRHRARGVRLHEGEADRRDPRRDEPRARGRAHEAPRDGQTVARRPVIPRAATAARGTFLPPRRELPEPPALRVAAATLVRGTSLAAHGRDARRSDSRSPSRGAP